VAKYERSLNEYRRKNKGKGTELKKLRSKVTFLEKLIISKDNNEQNANKQMKKIEKERIDLQNRIKELEEEVYKKNKEHLN
jgi:chromosome segregation ATPase